ncbi:galectin-1-like [Trichosurus vulpecula]|uniref:galectin-1-like n=1 Tax=Trichosurus vulpecula TaxID=9337 RepID=UPI00186ACB7E|nr:galectin-1-like [Trichosurus vulpecula]
MAGECGGGKDVAICNLDLHHGVCIKIVGDILPDAKHFVLDLGKDYDNIGLHFNPRFRLYKDNKTIVCNSKKDKVYGKEQRVKRFPFQPKREVEVRITFERLYFKVKLPDGFEFTFPNRLHLQTIDYLATSGDFKFRSLTLD